MCEKCDCQKDPKEPNYDHWMEVGYAVDFLKATLEKQIEQEHPSTVSGI